MCIYVYMYMETKILKTFLIKRYFPTYVMNKNKICCSE